MPARSSLVAQKVKDSAMSLQQPVGGGGGGWGSSIPCEGTSTCRGREKQTNKKYTTWASPCALET